MEDVEYCEGDTISAVEDKQYWWYPSPVSENFHPHLDIIIRQVSFSFSLCPTTLMSVRCKGLVLIKLHYVSYFPHHPQVMHRSKAVLRTTLMNVRCKALAVVMLRCVHRLFAIPKFCTNQRLSFFNKSPEV